MPLFIAVERATLLSINLINVIKKHNRRYINEKHIVSLLNQTCKKLNSKPYLINGGSPMSSSPYL